MDWREYRARRLWAGLSQGEVARTIGFAQGMVSRAEYGKGSPGVVAALNEYWWKVDREAEAATMQQEAERVAYQESLWNAVPDGPEKAALKAAMLQRAYDLMNEGDGTQTDAICDFLPKADVLAMFDQWERDSFPVSPADETPPEGPPPSQP